MIDIVDKTDCCGCNACVQCCSKQCITMQEDEEGFLYPSVDKNLCINCGLCEKVCSVINQYESCEPLIAYAAKNQDTNIQASSSSGGIFTSIAEIVIREDGVVFGARFDDKWEVVHDYIETIDELIVFRGSKYVQSRIGNSFLEAEGFLKQGRKVLFTGTPCQISGLNHFLHKDYDNLLTLDVACHGVPSPLVWREYLKYTTENRHISYISFRDKRISWEQYGLSVRTRDFDESSDEERDCFEPVHNNLYMQIFLKDLDLRSSCHACTAKVGRSHSDITLADFWGIQSVNPSLHDKRGVSLVLANSEKGSKVIDKLGIDKTDVPFLTAIRYNPSLIKSTPKPKQRAEFWVVFKRGGFDECRFLLNSMEPSIVRRILNKLHSLIN